MAALEGFDLEFVATHGAPSAELLAFYRAKVAAHEGERRDLLARLADAEAAGAELQRLRWEARERDEEVRELQRALSDARLALLDEREQALKLAAENDGLKAQEVEDRRRIAHLLALTEPLTHEVCAAMERAQARFRGALVRACARKAQSAMRDAQCAGSIKPRR